MPVIHFLRLDTKAVPGKDGQHRCHPHTDGIHVGTHSDPLVVNLFPLGVRIFGAALPELVGHMESWVHVILFYKDIGSSGSSVPLDMLLVVQELVISQAEAAFRHKTRGKRPPTVTYIFRCI